MFKRRAYKGVRERAVGVGVARGAALDVNGSRVVGGVSREKDRAVGEDHATANGHPHAYSVGAFDALAIDH